MTSRITSGQIAQLNQITESAMRKRILTIIDELGPTKELAQLAIVEKGNEFQAAISEGISSAMTLVLRRFLFPSNFAQEEVFSRYGYPTDYKRKGIAAQIKTLQEIFPGIGCANQDLVVKIQGGLEIPLGAEGFFAIPHWSKIAKTYEEAVEKVLMLLEQFYHGRLMNNREGRLGVKYLCEDPVKILAMKKLQDEQNADILILPAQFGKRHRGRSFRRAHAVMHGSEFGLGAYEIGIMLLTHAKRLQSHNDLLIHCAGDLYRHDPKGEFVSTPCFGFMCGGLSFSAEPIAEAIDHYGSVTGFSFD